MIVIISAVQVQIILDELFEFPQLIWQKPDLTRIIWNYFLSGVQVQSGQLQLPDEQNDISCGGFTDHTHRHNSRRRHHYPSQYQHG